MAEYTGQSTATGKRWGHYTLRGFKVVWGGTNICEYYVSPKKRSDGTYI